MNKSILGMNHSQRYQADLAASSVSQKACDLGKRAAALIANGWQAPSFREMSLDDILAAVVAEELRQADAAGITPTNYTALLQSDPDRAEAVSQGAASPLGLAALMGQDVSEKPYNLNRPLYNEFSGDGYPF